MNPGQPGPGPKAQAQTAPAPRTRSALELLPLELKGIVAASLTGEDLVALARTSREFRNFIQLPANQARIWVARVDAYLKKPHTERKLEDLVLLGLLPRSALLYPLEEEHLATLLADNVIKGLRLNKDIGVEVDLEVFSQAPGERMPPVENGEVDPEWSDNAIFSHENFANIQLETGQTVTILSRLVKSNVFANVWADNSRSLFNSCLDAYAIGKTVGGNPDPDLAKHWARVVHPDILGIPRRPEPMGVVGSVAKCDGMCLSTAVRTHKDIVEILLARGADFNMPRADERLPLTVAMWNVHADMEVLIDMLLKHGVEVDAVDISRCTALHFAAMFGHPHIVALLIRHNADVNHLDESEKNPLHNAFKVPKRTISESERLELTQHLVHAGVNLFQRDNMGARPVDYLRRMAETQPCSSVIAFVEGAMRVQRPGSV